MYVKHICLGTGKLPYPPCQKKKLKLAKLNRTNTGKASHWNKLTSSGNLLCNKAILPCLGGNRVNIKSH